MWLGRSLLLLVVAWTSAACMTIRPASTAGELAAVLRDGDVPALVGANALAMAQSSKRPFALLLTSATCGSCSDTRTELWSSLRHGDAADVAYATLDVDQAQAVWKQLGSPPLPAIVLFAEGRERWRVFGVDGARELCDVAKEHPKSWVHGLHNLPEGTPAPRGARVFLVAASADSAAFAQEVVDQVAYWRSRGLRPDEVACYVAVPSFGTYWGDRAQFDKLAKDIAQCYRADLTVVSAHWRAAAAAKPPSLYLYATSHGVSERSGQSLARSYADDAPGLKAHGGGYAAEPCKRLGHAQLLFDSIPGAPEALSFEEIFSRTCRGLVSPNPALTAQDLGELLRAAPKATPKVIVLQGCHSGGVVPSLLPTATTVLTAASPDRSSFGCNADGDRTVYGEKFLQVLRARNPDPTRAADWIPVHDEVRRLVEVAETELKIEDRDRSQPQIFAGATP